MDRCFLYYTESFCNPSETFVYRIAQSIRKYEPVILTHNRIHEQQYPGGELTVVERPQEQLKPISKLKKFMVNTVAIGIPANDLMSKKQIGELLETYSFSLLFSQFATCGINLLAAARYLQLPLVTMFHGCDLSSWLRFRFYRVKLKRLFTGGNAFVVATNYMKNKAIELGCPLEKIQVIPYPVPLVFDTFDERPEGTNQDPIRFIHVGRLQEKKGILYSLKAFAQVCASNANCEFVIIGDGPQRPEAEQLSQKLGIANKTYFLGQLLFDQVKEELAKADIYLQHSVTAADGDTEGFGVSLAEASSAFLPVVVTRHNGFPEVVLDEKTGFLVPEHDIDAMARAMNLLVESPELRIKFGNAGHAHVKEQFSYIRVGKSFENLFDTIIGEFGHSQQPSHKKNVKADSQTC